jgi:hypothetical protein
MLFGEVGGNLGFEIEDPDHFVFYDQRDCKLGSDVRVGLDVVFRLTYIFDQERFAEQGCLPDDSSAWFYANSLDFGGMAYLEAHPELLGAVVYQEDGEDAVVDDGSDEVGYPVHQGIEVECRVEGVGERVKELDLVEGFDLDICSLRRHLGTGAVISFEVVFGRHFRRWRGRWGCGAALFVIGRHPKSR